MMGANGNGILITEVTGYAWSYQEGKRNKTKA